MIGHLFRVVKGETMSCKLASFTSADRSAVALIIRWLLFWGHNTVPIQALTPKSPALLASSKITISGMAIFIVEFSLQNLIFHANVILPIQMRFHPITIFDSKRMSFKLKSGKYSIGIGSNSGRQFALKFHHSNFRNILACQTQSLLSEFLIIMRALFDIFFILEGGSDSNDLSLGGRLWHYLKSLTFLVTHNVINTCLSQCYKRTGIDVNDKWAMTECCSRWQICWLCIRICWVK